MLNRSRIEAAKRSVAMSKEKDWTESFGKKLAVFSRIYAFLASTWSRMGIGPEIIDWITTHEGVKAFREAAELFGERFLAATEPVVEFKPTTFADFPVWKTIRRNSKRKTADDYRRALQDKGYKISGWGDLMLKKVDLLSGENEYVLYVLFGHDLGFNRNATFEEIYESAVAKGFVLCPGWIGPALREEHLYQSEGDVLLISMVPIIGSSHSFDVFCVCSEDGSLVLSAYSSNPRRVWAPDTRWVFALPRRK